MCNQIYYYECIRMLERYENFRDIKLYLIPTICLNWNNDVKCIPALDDCIIYICNARPHEHFFSRRIFTRNA